MYASAMAISTKANNRAASSILSFSDATTVLVTLFQPASENSYQNLEYDVWSGVRTLLLSLPVSFTSSKSLAYAADVNDGKGAQRNWSFSFIAKGFTSSQ